MLFYHPAKALVTDSTLLACLLIVLVFVVTKVTSVPEAENLGGRGGT